MKKTIMVVCWAVSAGTIIYAVANPTNGIAFRGPWYTFCLGLIGLGLYRHARAGEVRRAAKEVDTH